jgi:3-oxoacyl-[acyl-carrier-protein] synthase III
VVLQASKVEGGVLSSVLGSDGAGADLLAIPTTNSRELNGHKVQKMHMAGSEVFKFATRVVDESIRKAVADAGIELKDVNLVVPHQANLRILQSASKKLGIDLDRWVSNLDRYGNTSAASIPLALAEAVSTGRVKANDYLVFIGFGGGLSWASMVVKWMPKIKKGQTVALNKQRRQLSYGWARWRKRFNRWRMFLSRLFQPSKWGKLQKTDEEE